MWEVGDWGITVTCGICDLSVYKYRRLDCEVPKIKIYVSFKCKNIHMYM